MENHAQAPSRARTYIITFLTLGVLTMIEFGAATLTGAIKLPTLLLLATIKALLVAGIYMHLRYDKRVFRVMVLLIIEMRPALVRKPLVNTPSRALTSAPAFTEVRCETIKFLELRFGPEPSTPPAPIVRLVELVKPNSIQCGCSGSGTAGALEPASCDTLF